MFRTDKNTKRTAPFTKGDKVVIKINTEGLSDVRIAEARAIFSEIYEVMYFSFSTHNWVCQDQSGNQCRFDTNKIEIWDEEKHGNWDEEQFKKFQEEYRLDKESGLCQSEDQEE